MSLIHARTVSKNAHIPEALEELRRIADATEQTAHHTKRIASHTFLLALPMMIVLCIMILAGVLWIAMRITH